MKMKNLTGQQKVFAIEMVDASRQSGVSKNTSMEQTAKHMGISQSQIKRLMRAEETERVLADLGQIRGQARQKESRHRQKTRRTSQQA